MKSWKRVVLFTAVLAGLAAGAATIIGEQEASAVLCCSVCDDTYERCYNYCGGDETCLASCETNLLRCEMRCTECGNPPIPDTGW